ncbi:MAG TPA: GNAT family protein [Methanomicrobiales archaeon]|jgi:RimJ/RimL family protein N-acetyltransferase|nr:GNAT family protein [Methanomicrobiales archaeon]
MPQDPAITLDPSREEDLPRLNEIVNEPDVVRYLDLIPPVPFKQTLEFFWIVKVSGGMMWSIRVEGEVAGAVGLIPEMKHTKLAHGAGLFIYLEKPYWGQGIASFAIRFALDQAKEAGIERIEVLVVDKNTRALELFQNNGFEYEGLLKKAFKDDGEYQNLVLLARLL